MLRWIRAARHSESPQMEPIHENWSSNSAESRSKIETNKLAGGSETHPRDRKKA